MTEEQKKVVSDLIDTMICMGCNQSIEDEEWMVMNEHGPLGIFEPEEVGKLHMSCYRAMEAEEEEFFEEDELDE